MSGIEVTRDAPDGLSGQLWVFRVVALYLGAGDSAEVQPVYYARFERPTLRHKRRPVGVWEMTDERAYRSSIKRAEVPFPADVLKEAVARVKITAVDANGKPFEAA